MPIINGGRNGGGGKWMHQSPPSSSLMFDVSLQQQLFVQSSSQATPPNNNSSSNSMLSSSVPVTMFPFVQECNDYVNTADAVTAGCFIVAVFAIHRVLLTIAVRRFSLINEP